MDRPATAARLILVAVGVGIAAELLLDGHALGVNVPLATATLLVAAVSIAGGLRRLDSWDRWIPLTALTLAAFVAVRDDGPLALLNVVGALGLTGASAAALAGEQVTRRSSTAATALAGRVAAATLFGGMALIHRLRAESALRGPVVDRSRRALPVARGLAIAVPMLAVFGALFASADPVFGRWLDQLFSLDVELGDVPGRALFAAAATWLAGGLLWFVAVARPVIEPRSLGAAAAPARVGWARLGIAESVTVLVALDLLFGVFVALQVAYLFGGLDTVSAIGMSYATYARRGFFELVAVVVLAGGLLLGLEAVVERRTRAYVAAALALVGLSAVVLASSFLRLRLYQEAYGWTELRFYVLAAIVFLALCLGWAAVAIAGDRSRWLPHAVLASSLVVLLLVNVLGPQGFVTDRNLERALDPTLVPSYGETALDAAYLGGLGADAIPALVASFPGLSPAAQADLLPALRRAHRRYVRDGDPAWQAANLARLRARDALVGLFGP